MAISPEDVHDALMAEMLQAGQFEGDAIKLHLSGAPGEPGVTASDYLNTFHADPDLQPDTEDARRQALELQNSILYVDLTDRLTIENSTENDADRLYIASPSNLNTNSMFINQLVHKASIQNLASEEVIVFHSERGIVALEDEVVGRALVAQLRARRALPEE